MLTIRCADTFGKRHLTPIAVDDLTLLRHLLATLAYRAAKVLRDAPPGFATFGDRPGRRPLNIVAHLADVMEWGMRLAAGEYR